MKTVSGIYKIRNLINNKIYIGSTINFRQRWYTHKTLLTNNKHPNSHLQNAWNKYGPANFVFEIMEILLIKESETKSDFKQRLVKDKEQYYLDINKSFNRDVGYNINKIADSNLGRTYPDSVRENIDNVGLR